MRLPPAKLLVGNRWEGAVEGYSALEWTRAWLAPGTFRLTIKSGLVGARGLALDRFIEPPGEKGLVYLLEQIETNEDDQDELIVTGRTLDGFLMERDCVPSAGQMHDTMTAVAPETAMKGYFGRNIGPSAPAVARIAGLVAAADQARPAGVTDTYQARYQYVGELLAEIGAPAGLGWETRLDYATGNWVFDVLPGVDRATGAVGDRVYLDVAFDSALAQQWLTGNTGRKTVARVLGQGEGAARMVRVVWLGMEAGVPEPTGFARRVLVIDARDLAAEADLIRRGKAKLAELAAQDSFTTEVNSRGSFRYRPSADPGDTRAWFDLGDRVLVRNEAWGVEQIARIVTVRSRLARETGGAPAIAVELGRPAPTLGERLRGAAIGTGSARD